MDTFDIRKYITEGKLQEQKKAYIEYTDGSTEDRQFHQSVSDEKIKKMFEPGTYVDGKLVQKVLVGDSLDKVMNEQEDVLEPKDVPEKEPEKEEEEEDEKIEFSDKDLEDIKILEKEIAKNLAKNIEEIKDSIIDISKLADVIRLVKNTDFALAQIITDEDPYYQLEDYISTIINVYFEKYILTDPKEEYIGKMNDIDGTLYNALTDTEDYEPENDMYPGMELSLKNVIDKKYNIKYDDDKLTSYRA
jgi:hypothetical protein